MTRKLVTKGEELFQFVREQVFTPPNTVAMKIPQFAKRSNHLLEFVDGAVLYHTHARIMRLARAVQDRDDLQSELVKAAALKRALLQFMDIGAGTCSDIDHLVDLALESASMVNKSINITTQREVLNEFQVLGVDIHCYICDGPLDRAATQFVDDPILAEIDDADLRSRVGEKLRKDKNKQYLEFDHLWPQSLGGDSIAANLLPICPHCNRAKTDLASWEWALVQSTVLPPMAYSPDVLTNVGKSVKIALYMRAAFLVADDSGISLKEAYKLLGPKEEARVVEDTDTTDFFNIEVHNRDGLASLWRF